MVTQLDCAKTGTQAWLVPGQPFLLLLEALKMDSPELVPSQQHPPDQLLVWTKQMSSQNLVLHLCSSYYMGFIQLLPPKLPASGFSEWKAGEPREAGMCLSLFGLL